jgi:cobalt-zinc-cadmium efflux system protein
MTDIAKNTIKSSSNIKKLKIVFLLSSFYFVSAVIIVLITGSLSLLSEAGHMLADIGGFALALFAINYSRKLPTPERTYGFFRMEILASLTNSVILILLSVYIIYEGFVRIFAPPEIHGFPIIVAAVVGLIVNFISMYMLSEGKGVLGHSHGLSNHDTEKEQQHSKNAEEQNLNVKAIYLETLSDTIGAAGVLAAGLIMLSTHFYLADPIISIGLAFFMIPRTWSIIKKAVHILMEGSPYNIPHDEVKEAILKIRGVTGLFELHIWTITSGMHALSAHVVIIDPSRSQEILQEINSILEKKFKITHATIQLERYHSESNLFKP